LFQTQIGFSVRSDLFHREYNYVNISMKWTDAQRYCREKHTDLATFDSMDDILKLNRPSLVTPYTWIGLWDDPRAWKEGTLNDDNSWKWSSTGKSLTGFSNWAKNQPNFYKALEKCAMIDTSGRWFDSFCSHKKSFVCYTESTPPGQKTYTFISIVTTWDKAQSYCRTHHTDLALIENDLENMSALKHQSGFVWIGLRREPWVWSDGSNSSFTNWNTGQPDNSGYNDLCVVELDEHKWEDAPCIKEFVFLCYEGISTVPHRVYHYVNMRMSWADAQSYCRDKYKDLATFESMEDIQKLKRPSVASAQAWIGLRDDPKSWKETFGNATNSWRWSATEKPSFTNYSNWKDGSPKRFREQRYCSLVMVSGDWTEATCSQIREFICFDGKNLLSKHFLEYNKFNVTKKIHGQKQRQKSLTCVGQLSCGG
uniref:C-type lectin domain-containing protein n=1 Tax=Gouania willdenowi TaxID=441366 RepID=A0A8C5EFP1_GOUWI